jgi:quercetin dioxygenase-like cupin family protein
VKTFRAFSDLSPILLAEGLTARAVNGERITMALVDLEPNSKSPDHHHENEQLGFVVSGSIEFRVGDDKRVLHAGDSYVIPSHVPHQAVAGAEGATVLDIFAPVRADWEKLERSDPAPGRWP